MELKKVDNHIPRLVEKKLEKYINGIGGVLIEGPKSCGKTHLGQRYTKSQFRLQDYSEDQIDNFLYITNSNPIFDGPKPRLIDEWQLNNNIWDMVKVRIDQANENRQYVLTGSTRVSETKKRHDGSGRIARLRMWPLTVSEILQSDSLQWKLKLSDLFKLEVVPLGSNQYDQNWLNQVMVKGGWPQIYAKNTDQEAFQISYLDNIFNVEKRNHNLNHKLKTNLVKSVFAALVRHNGKTIVNDTLLKDLEAKQIKIATNTLKKYLQYFEDLFLFFDLQIWPRIYRMDSKTRFQSRPKTYLVDPSLGLWQNDVTNSEKLLTKPGIDYGTYFENLVIRDLMVYAQTLDAHLYFYHEHDKYGIEIDAILELSDGSYGAIEIKWGGYEGIQKGIDSLLRFNKKMAANPKVGPAKFLMIITSCPDQNIGAYQTKDGIYVVPHQNLSI